MERGRVVAAQGSIRRVPERWRKTGFVLAGLLLCEIGARIAAPGLVGRVLGAYLRRGGTGLLWLYDRLVGGALSRGGILALGVMPYLSARIFMRLARVVSPALDELHTHEAGRTKLTRWTRVLTVGLALVQSYGFARFALTLPGAVTNPGVGFVPQTMLVLTGGAIAAMLLGEQITALGDADTSSGVEEQDVRHAQEPTPASSLAQLPGALQLPAAAYPGTEAFQQRREPVGVPLERPE